VLPDTESSTPSSAASSPATEAVTASTTANRPYLVRSWRIDPHTYNTSPSLVFRSIKSRRRYSTQGHQERHAGPRAPWFWPRYTACMLIPRDVVEAAKAGGWNPFGEPYEIERVEHDTIYFGNREFSHFFGVNDLASDKCFWQALAISFSWTRRFIVISYGIAGIPEYRTLEQWEHEARRFFALLLIESDTDAFWRNAPGSTSSCGKVGSRVSGCVHQKRLDTPLGLLQGASRRVVGLRP
jgi:hypothetical protein